MTARVLEVCDAVVRTIEAQWAPISPDGVSRAYLPDLSEGPRGEWPTGRRVYVFPVAYSQARTVSRDADETEYVVGFSVFERYTSAGVPPDEWVDERVDWVERTLYDALGDARLASILGACVPETAEVLDVYDPELLRQTPGAFVSEVRIAFREVAEA